MNDIVEHAFATFVFSSLNIIANMAQKVDTGSEKATRAFMCSLFRCILRPPYFYVHYLIFSVFENRRQIIANLVSFFCVFQLYYFFLQQYLQSGGGVKKSDCCSS